MFAALLLALAPVQAPVAPPPLVPVVMPPVLIVNPWPTPRPWQVTKGRRYCGAEQMLPTANAAVLLDTNDSIVLFVVAPDVSMKRKQPEAIELQLDGRAFQGLRAVGYQTDPVMKGFMVWIDN